MLELVGNNLGKRQHELNRKVHEAFNKKTYFNKVKHKEEKSDVDRLFKIDLAVAYRSLDYILDTLKCGDSLYISRALKCSWLHENEFKHVINPDYLHLNIFPFMSIKMKKKTLATIALHTKDAMKAQDFYTYCISAQIENIAWDFVIKTSDDFKKQYLISEVSLYVYAKFEQFFGDSFDLIEFYLKAIKTTTDKVDGEIFKLRYLYSFSPEKYLDFIETYTELPTEHSFHNCNSRFGLRISKNIMVHHKSRVLNKPWLYIKKLNVKMIVKYSCSNDAKMYLEALLPDTAEQYWYRDYYTTYKDFIQLLNSNDIYPFLKQIFTKKYPNQNFEMNINFCSQKYYNLLTPDERSAWAWNKLKNDKFLRPGQDVFWYQFMKFDVTFPEIKKRLLITTCPVKRSEMYRVLLHAASNQYELEKVLIFYDERYINENSDHKEKFISDIIEVHNIFELNEKCWKSLSSLFHSLNTFAISQFTDMNTVVALIYNIIHNIEMPEILVPHSKTYFYGIKSSLFTLYYKLLRPDQHQLVYQWFMKYFENSIKELMEESRNDDEVKKCLVNYTRNVLSFMDGYKKTKDDCPKIVLDCMKLFWDDFLHHKWLQAEILSEGLLLRLLKKDNVLLTNKLPEIKEYNRKTCKIFRFKKLLQKIKTYFPNDVTKTFQTFFEELLSNELEKKCDSMYNQIIFSIFHLGDENYKLNLMSKNAPTKGNRRFTMSRPVNNKLLPIQKAICMYSPYSRPPMPLPKILEYITEDTVDYCRTMFSFYLVSLPLPQSLKFVEALLNAPVSIQKHGLILAFASYNTENLKQLVLEVWNHTKNVSLRALIYKALFDKIKEDETSAQLKLYTVLKVLTSNMHEDDLDDIFDLLVSSDLPSTYNGDYLETAWLMVRTLPKRCSISNKRKTDVMIGLVSHMEQIDREFCRTQIINEHIRTQFVKKQILRKNAYGIGDLSNEKWNLTAKYITHFDDDELNSSIEVLQLIMNKCHEMWNEVRDNKFMVRAFLIEFLRNLKYQTDERKDRERKPYMVPIYENIMTFLRTTWPLQEIYNVIWELKLSILGATSIGNGKYNSDIKEISYHHLLSEEVAKKFAAGIVDFTKDLLSKQQFFSSFYPTIEDAIIETTRVMINWTNLDNHMLLCEVSYALTKFRLFEANMLALRILPVMSCIRNSNYDVVSDAITEFNNYELNAYMYHKFVYPIVVKRPK